MEGARVMTKITLPLCIVVALTWVPASLSDNIELKQPRQASRDMFPDGWEHDFGTVLRGTKCRHAFWIVNTSSRPLQIVKVRLTH
jgi:hypothetical protein